MTLIEDGFREHQSKLAIYLIIFVLKPYTEILDESVDNVRELQNSLNNKNSGFCS